MITLLLSQALAAEPASKSQVVTAQVTPPPAVWLKPLDPNVDPANATVVVAYVRPEMVGDDEFMKALSTWDPTGIRLVPSDRANKDSLLAALREVRDTNAGRVIVFSDAQGVGGDRDDAQIVPFGSNPDDAATTVRTSEFMKNLAGAQRSIGIVSWGAISAGMSPGGRALIGADADLWAEAFPTGMSGWVISSNDVEQPARGCGVSFGHILGQGMKLHHNSGADLTVGGLYQVAKSRSEVVQGCEFKPEKEIIGGVSLDDVLFKGTGVGPTMATATTGAGAPSTLPTEPLPTKPLRKRAVPLPVSIGAAGAGAALMGFAGVLALGIEADAKDEALRFEEANARTEFGSEEEARAEAERLTDEFRSRGEVALGLTIGGGALLVGGGVTIFVSDQGGILGFTGRW